MWAEALFIGTPLVLVAYAVVRWLMARSSGASESSWREITIIDIVSVFVIISIFYPLTPT